MKTLQDKALEILSTTEEAYTVVLIDTNGIEWTYLFSDKTTSTLLLTLVMLLQASNTWRSLTACAIHKDPTEGEDEVPIIVTIWCTKTESVSSVSFRSYEHQEGKLGKLLGSQEYDSVQTALDGERTCTTESSQEYH